MREGEGGRRREEGEGRQEGGGRDTPNRAKIFGWFNLLCTQTSFRKSSSAIFAGRGRRGEEGAGRRREKGGGRREQGKEERGGKREGGQTQHGQNIRMVQTTLHANFFPEIFVRHFCRASTLLLEDFHGDGLSPKGTLVDHGKASLAKKSLREVREGIGERREEK
jgi:hypothetical protein